MEKSEAMQIGRKLAYLRKCQTAQELLLQYETDKSIRKRVFEDHIKPVLNNCSYATFNNMLNVVNPKEQIELLTIKN